MRGPCVLGGVKTFFWSPNYFFSRDSLRWSRQKEVSEIVTCACECWGTWLSWASRFKAFEANSLFDLGSKLSICKRGLQKKKKGFPRVINYPFNSSPCRGLKLSLPLGEGRTSCDLAPLPQLAWAQLKAEHGHKERGRGLPGRSGWVRGK